MVHDERLPLESDPDTDVVVHLDPKASWWECKSCHQGHVGLGDTLARIAAWHHAQICGRTWADIDPAHREIIAEAAGARWLVRLPVGTTGHHVELRSVSGLRDLEWRCGHCGTTGCLPADLAHAEAAVHAAHCDRRTTAPLPERYLDTLEDAAGQRITERVNTVVTEDGNAAKAMRIEFALLRDATDQVKTLTVKAARLEGERDAALDGQVLARRTVNALAAVLVFIVAGLTFLP